MDACVLRPANRMIEVAEKFEAPLTFFAEALEFIAMSEQVKEYRPTKQLNSALTRGHDVQLHLHPQWQRARYDHRQRQWRVDMARWRIGDLSQKETQELIRIGKQWVEGEVAKHVPGFRCLAFRAGGWCIQPAGSVVSSLVNLDFRIDSTVAPGLWNPAPGEWSDFRKVPSLPWWRVSGDVCVKCQEGKLIEVPIVTGRIPRWKHLSALKQHRAVNGGLAEGCVGYYTGPGGLFGRISTVAAKLFKLGMVMLDFSTMPADVLIQVTEQWMERFSDAAYPVPLVAIAHTKNFTTVSERNLRAYLTWARDVGLRFSTYGQWLKAIYGNQLAHPGALYRGNHLDV